MVRGKPSLPRGNLKCITCNKINYLMQKNCTKTLKNAVSRKKLRNT